MFHFLAIMLNIYIENRFIGGYTSYLQEKNSVGLEWGYAVTLTVYEAPKKDIMPFICFNKFL